MSDDVDDQLRHAMASLDRQVPPRYFETLADRTLARLDDAAPADFVAEEIVTEAEVIAERDEHSGLQDIRNLASETKARLVRRTSQQVIAREDRIASSSAGWKAVALPDPARRVPELGPSEPIDEPIDELIDELARERAARAAVSPVSPATIGSGPPVTSRGAAPPLASKRRRWLAITGTAVAAAAGVMIVVSARSADRARPPSPSSEAASAAPASAAAPIAAPPPSAREAATSNGASAQGQRLEPATPVSAGSAAAIGAVGKPPGKPVAKGKRPSKLGKMPDPDQLPEPPPDAPGARDATAKPPAGGTPGAGSAQGSAEPSFDALVREAGIASTAPAKPTLDRQALSSADVKRGLAAVAPQAHACFTGTEGVAAVRLTVAPTGKVTKVTTTGPFAGTPTAACVERAVKSATFPPWDGGPLSVAYSYLLSE
jgi:hypothetical protein